MLELLQLRQTVFCEVHPQKWLSMINCQCWLSTFKRHQL